MSTADHLDLRDARHEDLPAIVAIYNASIPGRLATADTEPVTVASREAWFIAHDPTTRPLWVVENDREILGWVSFRSFYGRPAYQRTVELGIYLAPQVQGRGVGRWLLGEAIARAPQHGIDVLLGFIFAHNQPSMCLFQGAGFTPWGLLPGVAILDGVRRDLAILGRRL